MGKATIKRNHEPRRPSKRGQESPPPSQGEAKVAACALCGEDMKKWKGDVINIECCARMCGGSGRFHAHCVRTHFEGLSTKERKRLGIAGDQVYTSSVNCFKSFPCVAVSCKGKITRSGFERGTERDTVVREAYTGPIPKRPPKTTVPISKRVPEPRKVTPVPDTTIPMETRVEHPRVVDGRPETPPLPKEQPSLYYDPVFCTPCRPSDARASDVIYGWTPFDTPLLFNVMTT